MESVVGTRVLIHLHRQAYEMLSIQGLESERFVALVIGVDGFGLWIENPSYCTVPTYDDKGQYIPPEERREVCHRAAVLIQWGFIQTILQFPDRMQYRPSADETELGFRRHIMDLTTEASQRGGIVTPDGGGKISVPVGSKPGGKASQPKPRAQSTSAVKRTSPSRPASKAAKGADKGAVKSAAKSGGKEKKRG
jgi:hypothetical protein